MATTSVLVSSILLLGFVLAISFSETARALASNQCEKSSKTFSGNCDNKKCDQKCIEWEKAAHGACHSREGKNNCYCYYDDCAKAPPPSGGAAGGSGGGGAGGGGGGSGGGDGKGDGSGKGDGGAGSGKGDSTGGSGKGDGGGKGAGGDGGGSGGGGGGGGSGGCKHIAD